MNNRLPSVDLLEQERSAPLGVGRDELGMRRPIRSPPSGASVPWLGDDLSTPPTFAGFPVLPPALSLIGVQTRPEPAGEGPWRARGLCARHRPAAPRGFVRPCNANSRTGAAMKDGGPAGQ